MLTFSWILRRGSVSGLPFFAEFAWFKWNRRWNWEMGDGWWASALWRICFWLYRAIYAGLVIIASSLFLRTDPLFFIIFTSYLSSQCDAEIFTSLSSQTKIFSCRFYKFWSTPSKSWYWFLSAFAEPSIFSSWLCYASWICLLLNGWSGREWWSLVIFQASKVLQYN